MKKLLGWFVVLAVAFFGIVGCLTTESVCEDANLPTGENPSLLCKAADDLGVKLEHVSLGIRVANVGAIGSGVYTSSEALGALTLLRAILGGPITYSAFKSELLNLSAQYPGMLEIGQGVLNTFVMPKIMHPKDVEILTVWLDNRIAELKIVM